MNKIIYCIVLSFLCVSCTIQMKDTSSISWSNYKWYTIIHSWSGVTFLQNKKWDVSLLDVDLTQAWISFWGVHLSNTRTHNSNHNEFKRFRADETSKYLNIAHMNWSETLAYINGQFFTHIEDTTLLSFPVKSDWKILSSYMDNELKKRTLAISKTWKAYVSQWFNTGLLSDRNYPEVIVGINPVEDFIQEREVGRSYVWLMSENKIVFFITKTKNQAQMTQILSDYWVAEQNMIMFDGWPSAQFNYQWQSFYGDWWVPQYTIVYSQ